MSALEKINERCLDLFEDLHFKAAREWKAAEPGRKVVGFMPVYVPREIIHAAGMLPLGITGGGDQMEVIHGDAYYQSYICRIPRSTIELGVSGRLDFVDGMLFPSICDVIRNLSGMWKLMFPNVYTRYFDVPQNYIDDIGGNYYTQELAELVEGLGDGGGHDMFAGGQVPIDECSAEDVEAITRQIELRLLRLVDVSARTPEPLVPGPEPEPPKPPDQESSE